MPLTWDVSNVADHEHVCFMGEGDVRQASPITQAIVMMSMSIRIGSITEKNAGEFYARLYFLEKLDGPFVVKEGEPYHITPEDVRAHVGMYVNVTTESRAKFLNSFKVDLDARVREYEKAQREAVAA